GMGGGRHQCSGTGRNYPVALHGSNPCLFIYGAGRCSACGGNTSHGLRILSRQNASLDSVDRNEKKRAVAGHEDWLVRIGEQGVERLEHGRLAAASDGNRSSVAENKPEARTRGDRAYFLVPLDPVPEEAAAGHHIEVGNR